MRDDVVEFAHIVVQIEQTHGPQRDISEAELPDDIAPGVNLPGRQIDAEKLASRQLRRHGNEIPAIRAPQFQDTTLLDVGRDHAVQESDDRQAVRMGQGSRP